MGKISLDVYDIFVEEGLSAFNEFLAGSGYSKIVVLVDENTRKYCLPALLVTSIPDPDFIEIPSGEAHKNIETCKFVWQQMIDRHVDRKALMINIGGGVIGDMGGFCAGTFKRGIDFIQIPTTLLAQVDASIGGKLGIDFSGVKNSIGLFCNPRAVFINPLFLKTLPEREIRSGFAEMLKHGLIADARIWNELKATENFGNIDWQEAVISSLKIKKQIVEADPLEQNIRKKLNFGHTIGHAIEAQALQSGQSVLHGEAIAAGMICEAWLSVKFAGLSKAELNEIQSTILKIYGKINLNESDLAGLLEWMKNDKKNEGKDINFTLLKKIGTASINHICSEKMILESLGYYAQL